MRIALIGTRGVPASYSGFETCVENLGARLAQRGHAITVYNRAHHIHYTSDTYKGMRLVRVRGIATKHLDTITHTTVSFAHALSQRYEAIYVFIAGNAPLCIIPRLLSRTRVILNVDGLDWKRRKWGALARQYIQWSERLSTRLAHVVVTDSRQVCAYYRQAYNADTAFIPYGADVTPRPPGDTLRRFGLAPGQYVLFVGRLVPENCAHHLVDAWRQTALGQNAKCVIVGDAPYAARYINELRARAGGDESIVFTGYQFGDAYAELCSHAQVFVETSEVGGTHPALVEAMAFGNCVVVNDTPENMETIGSAGARYSGAAGAPALAAVLQSILADPAKIAGYRASAQQRANAEYTWDRVTDQYEHLLWNERLG